MARPNPINARKGIKTYLEEMIYGREEWVQIPSMPVRALRPICRRCMRGRGRGPNPINARKGIKTHLSLIHI